MRNTNLFFENLSDEQAIDLNGGSVTGVIIAIVSGIITAYGIYETGKNHIRDYNYNKAYKAEWERLENSKP
jgi:hypothetical protein